MHVVVGGASGFLGSALVSHLRHRGHEVTRLVRSGPPRDDASVWSPSEGRVDQVLIDRCDAVVNLSGSPISQWPRTKRRAREILESRLGATGTLARAVAASSEPPALVSGSGMSWYGVDRGQEVLTEESGPGDGFLADVAQAWERAAQPAVDAGARVSFVRTSLVMDAAGGVLKLMLPAFRLGGGARLGSGDQRMSLVTRDDWVRAVTWVVEHDDLAGPFNVAAPGAPTNREFTQQLASTLHRPALLAAPSFAIKAVLGGLADDLLGSVHVEPTALQASGFAFESPDLASTLADAIR